MKDILDFSYILGIRIYKETSQRLNGLSQSTYIDKIVKRFSMENPKRGIVPMLRGTIRSQLDYSSIYDEI